MEARADDEASAGAQNDEARGGEASATAQDDSAHALAVARALVGSHAAQTAEMIAALRARREASRAAFADDDEKEIQAAERAVHLAATAGRNPKTRDKIGWIKCRWLEYAYGPTVWELRAEFLSLDQPHTRTPAGETLQPSKYLTHRRIVRGWAREFSSSARHDYL